MCVHENERERQREKEKERIEASLKVSIVQAWKTERVEQCRKTVIYTVIRLLSI